MQVELCDGRKPIMPGQKAALGLYPVCIEVEATAVNPGRDTLKDVSVYGFVKVRILSLYIFIMLKLSKFTRMMRLVTLCSQITQILKAILVNML